MTELTANKQGLLEKNEGVEVHRKKVAFTKELNLAKCTALPPYPSTPPRHKAACRSIPQRR